MGHRLMLWAVAAVALGCSTDVGRDDSGNGTAVAADGGWFADSLPLLDIPATTSDGQVVLQYAAAGTRLSNGVLVVADGYADGVRFFDDSGRLLRTVGRSGSGPGEFREAWWLRQCTADSVFVWDRTQNRVSVIDTAGRFVRHFRPPIDPAVLACSSSGKFASIATPENMAPPNERGESPHYQAPLSITDTRGAITAGLGQVPLGETRPLGKITRLALTQDRLYVGTADSPFVDVYTVDGRRLGAVPVGTGWRSPSTHNYERAIDAQVAMLAERDYRESMKKWLLGFPMPEHLPPYTNLFADPLGILWAVISAPGDSLTQLRALGRDGRILADIRIPLDLTVFEVGYDYILGAYEDDNGEHHVVMYRLNRGR